MLFNFATLRDEWYGTATYSILGDSQKAMTEDSQTGATPDKKGSRRQALMHKAEELFAQKGIDAVSLNEINKAAGQRNTSALHYHFGNKKGLIDAIVYEHYAAIDQQINTLLDEFERLPVEQQTARKLLQATVTPFAQQLDSPQGINYLLIVSQVFMKSSDMILQGHPSGEDKARLRIFRLMQTMMADLPAQVHAARQVLYASLIFHSLAAYAQTAEFGKEHYLGSKELFTSNLLDNLEVVMKTAPSTETFAIIQKEKN